MAVMFSECLIVLTQVLMVRGDLGLGLFALPSWPGCIALITQLHRYNSVNNKIT